MSYEVICAELYCGNKTRIIEDLEDVLQHNQHKLIRVSEIQQLLQKYNIELHKAYDVNRDKLEEIIILINQDENSYIFEDSIQISKSYSQILSPKSDIEFKKTSYKSPFLYENEKENSIQGKKKPKKKQVMLTQNEANQKNQDLYGNYPPMRSKRTQKQISKNISVNSSNSKYNMSFESGPLSTSVRFEIEEKSLIQEFKETNFKIPVIVVSTISFLIMLFVNYYFIKQWDKEYIICSAATQIERIYISWFSGFFIEKYFSKPRIMIKLILFMLSMNILKFIYSYLLYAAIFDSFFIISPINFVVISYTATFLIISTIGVATFIQNKLQIKKESAEKNTLIISLIWLIIIQFDFWILHFMVALYVLCALLILVVLMLSIIIFVVSSVIDK